MQYALGEQSQDAVKQSLSVCSIFPTYCSAQDRQVPVKWDLVGSYILVAIHLANVPGTVS
jgi:hypothetical protein